MVPSAARALGSASTRSEAVTQTPAPQPDAADWSKMHVFLCNEKIPSLPCITGALEQTAKIGVPDANVHGFGAPVALQRAPESFSSTHAAARPRRDPGGHAARAPLRLVHGAPLLLCRRGRAQGACSQVQRAALEPPQHRQLWRRPGGAPQSLPQPLFSSSSTTTTTTTISSSSAATADAAADRHQHLHDRPRPHALLPCCIAPVCSLRWT